MRGVWIEHCSPSPRSSLSRTHFRLLSSRSLDGAPVQHASYGHIVNFVYLCVILLNFLTRIVLSVGYVGKACMCVLLRVMKRVCEVVMQ